MTKSITDMPPVGIEQAAEHFVHAVCRDGWGKGVVGLDIVNGRIFSLTRHTGEHFEDYFMHDGRNWQRRIEYEGRELK